MNHQHTCNGCGQPFDCGGVRGPKLIYGAGMRSIANGRGENGAVCELGKGDLLEPCPRTTCQPCEVESWTGRRNPFTVRI